MTRERLVRCVSCGSHVRAADPACPFCAAHAPSLGARGGIVAASLLALSACGGAGEPDAPADSNESGSEVVVETVPPTDGDDGIGNPDGSNDGDGSDDGGTDDERAEQAPVEPPPAAAYGGPPDDMVVQPMYGIAPE